jgi:hypothetical protein
VHVQLLWVEYDLEERYEEIMRKLTFVNDALRYGAPPSLPPASFPTSNVLVWKPSVDVLPLLKDYVDLLCGCASCLQVCVGRGQRPEKYSLRAHHCVRHA